MAWGFRTTGARFFSLIPASIAFIRGLDELQAAMEALPQKVAKRGLRQAVRAGAAPIQEAMATGAPKNSGFMADYIDVKTRVRRDELAASAFIGPIGRAIYPVQNRRPGYWGRTVALVARMLEFGTSRIPKHTS